MTFYGTTATGSGWVVPKKYVERVGDDGFKKAPDRRRALQVRLVHARRRAGPRGLRRLLAQGPERQARRPQEHSRRDHARGRAQARRRGRRLQLQRSGGRGHPSHPGAEAHHPAHQHRLLPRLHRSVGAQVAVGRPARAAGRQPGRRPQGHQRGRASWASPGSPTASCRGTWSSRCRSTRPPSIRRRPSSCWPRPAIPTASTAAISRRTRPTSRWARPSSTNLGAVGIRTRMRTMERAAFLTSWREKKLRGVLLAAQGAGGNAATRIEGVATKGGLYAVGVLPEVEDLFQRQARELDRKKREELLHQIQRILHERVVFAPIWENAFTQWSGTAGRRGGADADHRLSVHGAVRGSPAQAVNADRGERWLHENFRRLPHRPADARRPTSSRPTPRRRSRSGCPTSPTAPTVRTGPARTAGRSAC